MYKYLHKWRKASFIWHSSFILIIPLLGYPQRQHRYTIQSVFLITHTDVLLRHLALLCLLNSNRTTREGLSNTTQVCSWKFQSIFISLINLSMDKTSKEIDRYLGDDYLIGKRHYKGTCAKMPAYDPHQDLSKFEDIFRPRLPIGYFYKFDQK